ncbi:hypothetical protein LARV_03827 [Longilinea arvoryzae]|uniref:DUF4179 domain-containing protein n=1 Tax=Longilinea arvoryzae TaxID=360412 RepID=A0A0K8MYB4_9CHLR|nr:hypothetical protein [Longilinea arvoryzae]GAP16031.1 hypothetical protein LARV_03827 [Longilinea arvoryzae]
MNQDLLISNALDELAKAGVSKHANPWPKIMAILIKEDKIEKPVARLRISGAPLIVLIALVMVTAAAYAFYRIMIDPGLQAVQDAGLVSVKNQPAQSTLFARQTSPAGNLAGTATPSIENLKVNLNWAYADEARVAFQITITGLNAQQAADINNFVCNPYITNDSGVHIGVNLADVNIHADQQWNSIDLTYIGYQRLDASKQSTINLSLDLTVGPCGPYWNFEENNLPEMTPYPVYGNYHLDFQTPVYPGVSILPGQTVEKNGIKMRLNEVTLNPSYIDLQLCYQSPVNPQLPRSGIEWMLDGVTLDWIGSVPIPMNEVLNGPFVNEQGEICETVGYAIPEPANQEVNRINVHVARLLAIENEGNLTDSFKEDAKEKLAQQGIEVDFETISLDNAHLWRILRKPAGMTDAEANQAVQNLLIHTIEGPWDFEFNPTP